MVKAIIVLLLSISATYGQALRVVLCSGSTDARKKLEASLNREVNIKDGNAINSILERWGREQRLTNPRSDSFAWIQRGDRVFKWPNPNKLKSVHNNRIGTLATRNAIFPTNDEITCFFQDTLVVIDSLRFYSGRSNKVRFALKINNIESEIPYDDNTNELIISAKNILNIHLGAYQSANITIYNGQESQELAHVVLYFFKPSEKKAILESLWNQESKSLACKDLINVALNFIDISWGGKQCLESNPYYFAQYKSLSRMINCQ